MPPAASLPALLASASADGGRRRTRVCSGLPQLRAGRPEQDRPDLWGVLGRDIASHEGFSYSSALSEQGGRVGL